MALNTATDPIETNTPKSGGGFTLGQSAADLVGLHGATPIAQASCPLLAGTLTGSVDGTIADIAATASAVVGGAGPSAAQVDTGIALAVSTIVSGTNLQLKELTTKLNAVITLLVNKGITGL